MEETRYSRTSRSNSKARIRFMSFNHRQCWRSIVIVMLLAASRAALAQSFPAFADLKPQAVLPDPLTMLDGKKITTTTEWEAVRRPELRRLFQHYMYGKLPPAPFEIQ